MVMLLCLSSCKKEPPTTPGESTPPTQTTVVAINGLVVTPNAGNRSFKVLSGAIVKLDSGTASARAETTNSAGQFAFAGINIGKHHLEVSYDTPTFSTLDTLITVTEMSDPLFLRLMYKSVMQGYVLRWALDSELPPDAGSYPAQFQHKLGIDATVILDGYDSVRTGPDPSRSYIPHGYFNFGLVPPGEHRIQIHSDAVYPLDTIITVTDAQASGSDELAKRFYLTATKPLRAQGYVQRQALDSELPPDVGNYPTQFQHKVGVDATVILDGHDSVRTGPDPSRSYVPQGYFDLGRVTSGQHKIQIHGGGIYPLDTAITVTDAQANGSDELAKRFYFTVALEPLGHLTEVFPLAVGARWVYDYQHLQTGNGYSAPNNRWEKGTLTFSALAVTDEGSRRRWTIREEDDLMQFDTTYNVPGVGVDVKPEVAIKQARTFTMLESASGLHQITADSCSMLWRVPSPFDYYHNNYGSGAFVLSRYAVGVNDSVVYYSQCHLPTYAVDSRALARDEGITRVFVEFVYGVNSRSQDFWWGTLREYTPGQASGARIQSSGRYSRPYRSR
jgi:hypothetical protein